ncbi:MAG: 4'-phosphopantetheinyl transferase superfamily protein [Fibrobacterota bacterium]|nr:4'-phosphopantetheinyl transferase superfamily protein [Fibrobacterota bacterium]
MIESILPTGVLCVEGPILTGGWDVMPEESALTAASGEKRKAEFLTGRTYARRALGLLGAVAPPLLSHADRSPIWPEGVAGCITHTREYCAVAVAKSTAFRSLGIDIENPGRISDAIGLKIFTDPEREALAAGPVLSLQERKSALFCAKEAFYKMQFPLTHAWIGFQDVNVVLEEDGTYALTLLKKIGGEFVPGRVFNGRFIVTPERVGTFMTLFR